MNLKNVVLFDKEFKQMILEERTEDLGHSIYFEQLCDDINEIDDLVVVGSEFEYSCNSAHMRILVLNHNYEIADNLQIILLREFKNEIRCGRDFIGEIDLLEETEDGKYYGETGRVFPIYHIEFLHNDKSIMGRAQSIIKHYKHIINLI